MKYLLILMSMLNLASGLFIILAGFKVIGIASINPIVFFLAMFVCAFHTVFSSVEHIVKHLRG